MLFLKVRFVFLILNYLEIVNDGKGRIRCFEIMSLNMIFPRLGLLLVR